MIFRLLLLLYPASWRSEYGEEMSRTFAARRRDAAGPAAVAALWAETLPDMAVSAAAVQWDVLRHDLRDAVRGRRPSPAFAAAAIAIAALGIGASTAVSTMVDHVLVRPLPFPDSARLVKIREADLSGEGRAMNETSPANFRDWRSAASSFSSMGAYRTISANLNGGAAGPQRVGGASLTEGVLPALGVQPAFGRTFAAADDRESAPATVVLSYGLWQETFGGDASVLGRAVQLDDVPHTVIGVMPRGFYFPDREARFWTTLRWGPQSFEDRRDTYVVAVARLRPGGTLDRARAEMRAIAARLARAFPKELAQTGISVLPLRADLSDRSRLALEALFGAASCVLLIACTNLANLLLARAMMRRRELAVRAALGAGRERLVRQMLTESLVLALAGGVLGVGLAYLALPLLAHLVPVSLPIAEAPAIDGRALLIAAALTIAAGLGFGVAPALRAGGNLAAGLREGGRSVGGGRERLRAALVIAQVACSIVLLAGFGLLTRALWRIQAMEPGFRAGGVLTMRTELPLPRYETPEAREPFYARVLGAALRLPGVTAAGYTSFLPMEMRGGIWPVEIEGRPEDIARRSTASLRFVTPGYFAAMGIPLLSGRGVRDTDGRRAPLAAVVSRSFAARYWPGENPLGRRFDIGNNVRTLVGIAGDVRVRGLERESEPQVYLPWQQTDGVSPWYAPKDLAVRTTGDPAALAAALRRIVREADPGQPVTNVRTLTDVVEDETAPRRAQLAVLGAFGAAAFLLAAVGIHGLLAFAVSSRTQEFGVRIALGAQRRDILGLTIGEALRLAAVGVAVGVATAAAAARLLESLLAGVAPWDAAVFAAAAGVAAVMALAGGIGPALRATRVDPASAIRAE